jgi:hypothetical protein
MRWHTNDILYKCPMCVVHTVCVHCKSQCENTHSTYSYCLFYIIWKCHAAKYQLFLLLLLLTTPNHNLIWHHTIFYFMSNSLVVTRSRTRWLLFSNDFIVIIKSNRMKRMTKRKNLSEMSTTFHVETKHHN